MLRLTSKATRSTRWCPARFVAVQRAYPWYMPPTRAQKKRLPVADPVAAAALDEGVEHWNRVAKHPQIYEMTQNLSPFICHHQIPPARLPNYSTESSPDKYAVVMVAKVQHKVVVGDVIMVHRLPDVEIGTMITLNRVLLVAGRNTSVIGRPLVPNCKVICEVQEHTTCGDILVFKFKRRKGYKRTTTHNVQATCLRIHEIQYTDYEV